MPYQRMTPDLLASFVKQRQHTHFEHPGDAGHIERRQDKTPADRRQRAKALDDAFGPVAKVDMEKLAVSLRKLKEGR